MKLLLEVVAQHKHLLVSCARGNGAECKAILIRPGHMYSEALRLPGHACTWGSKKAPRPVHVVPGTTKQQGDAWARLGERRRHSMFWQNKQSCFKPAICHIPPNQYWSSGSTVYKMRTVYRCTVHSGDCMTVCTVSVQCTRGSESLLLLQPARL